MDAATELRKIVDNARSNELERLEVAFASNTLGYDDPYGLSGKSWREVIERARKERIKWQGAKVLLDRFLQLWRLLQEEPAP